MSESAYKNWNLKVWLDGKLIDYEKAKVPILTHSLQYGSGMFEGIRAYESEKGVAIFRLQDHIKRFFNTAKIYNIDLGYTMHELSEAVISVVRANNLKSGYIRPFAFYNTDSIGLSAVGKKVSVFIAFVPFNKYLTSSNAGVKCKVSSWRRMSSSILPIQAKGSGNYLNSILANMEAKLSGFDEAILLSDNGYVAEGPGENIFIVKDKKLITPSKDANILLGITRDTIIQLAHQLNIEVMERDIHIEELYTSDEAFFCGTAAEITAITNIDGRVISNGEAGEITKLLIKEYSDLVHGKIGIFRHWLTIV